MTSPVGAAARPWRSFMSSSPWEMFLNTGPVVRTVMILLVLASAMSWTVFLAKSVEFFRLKRRLRAEEHILAEASSLHLAAERLRTQGGLTGLFIAAATDERAHSQDIPDDREGVKERIILHLERLEAAEGRRLIRGTGLLATIGATAPFVGLFGTVWGVMTSFTGIAAAKATSLAVVAPGIAEALLATALGLVAAIPAVVIYNHLVRQSAACRAQVADLTTGVMRLLSRDLARAQMLSPGGQVVRFGTRALLAE
ncbi:tonB-system energizer ExbB [Acidomonas methanolica]|nr:tonB-system energizer ExbB [Acidomonas methanolica]